MVPTSRRLLVVLALSLAAVLPDPASAGRDRWTPFGPPNGAFRTLVVDPVTPGTLYAAFESGALYKSIDSGRSWFWASNGMVGFEVRALAADPTRPGTLWAASESAVYRSVDGAASWQRRTPAPFRFLPAGAAIPEVDHLVAFPGSPPALFLSVAGRLWQSTDGGARWSTVLQTPQEITLLAAEPVRGVLYAGSILANGRLQRSADRGRTWSAVAPPPGGGTFQHLAFTAADPTLLYGATGRGLFRSRDRGVSWQTVRRLDPASGNLFTALAVDPAQPARLWTAYASSFFTPAVAESPDGGTTWVERRTGLAAGAVQQLVRPRATPLLYATGFNTLARLVDGRAGWASSTVSGFDVDDFDGRMRGRPSEPTTLYALRGGRLFRSTDGGRGWAGFGVAGTTNDLALAPDDPAGLWQAADSGLYYSPDHGATWESLDVRHTDAVVATGGSRVVAGGCGLRRSTDGGRTWQEAIACTDPGGIGHLVSTLTADPTTPRRLFARVAQFFFPFPQLLSIDLLRSEDHGATWQTIASDTSGLAFDPTRPGRLYTSHNGRLLVSDDAGSSWREAGVIRTGSTVWPAAGLVVDPDTPTTLYAASFVAGVLRSTDGGATWRPLNNGLACGSGGCQTLGLAAHPTVARRFVLATRSSQQQIDLP